MKTREKKVAKVDMKQMKRDRKTADAKSGGGILKIKEGTTLLYICPPVHAGDPMPYIEVSNCFDFGEGKDKKSITSAEGLEDNEEFVAALNECGIEYEDAQRGWEFAQQHAKFRPRWYFNVIPIAFRAGAGEDYEDLVPVIQKLGTGKQIYDGITDAFFEEGDISDPEAAIFISVTKKGSGLSTEYKVKFDSNSLKEPVELDEKLVEMIAKACTPGGTADLHKWLAGQVRTYDQVLAVFEGEEEPEIDKRAAKKRPARRRDREEEEEEETPKPARKKAAAKKKPEPVDEEEEADEEEEEAPKPARKKRATKKPAPVVEDEDDDEEEEEEEAPKPRKKASKKPAPVEDDEDEEEDEEEEAPKPKKAAPKKKAAPVEDDDDEDDDDEDDDDEDDLEKLLAERAKRRKSK